MTEEEARTKWPITGEKIGHTKGYVRLLCPLHPNADASGSVSGLCVEHYWEKIRSQNIKCAKEGCNERAGFRSGLCLKHIRELHNKRRYHHG